MNRKALIAALFAIGFSLSGVSQAVPLPMTKPDGTKTVANLEGVKLMLRDAAGKRWVNAGDGTYKTGDGKTLIVKAGVIVAQSGTNAVPVSNQGKGDIVGSTESQMQSDRPVLALDPSVKTAPRKAGTPAVLRPKTPSSDRDKRGWNSPTSPFGSSGKTQGSSPKMPSSDRDKRGWNSPTSPYGSSGKAQDQKLSPRTKAPATRAAPK